MVDKPKKTKTKTKPVFKCFVLKLAKLTFKSCHGNLDYELRPFQYRRKKILLLQVERWSLTAPRSAPEASGLELRKVTT